MTSTNWAPSSSTSQRQTKSSTRGLARARDAFCMEDKTKLIFACHQLLRLTLWSRLGVILGAVLFSCIFVTLQWLVPVTPWAIYTLGDYGEFLTFSPDSSVFVTARRSTCDRAGPLRVWDVNTGKERFAVAQDWTVLETVLFSPNGQLLAAHQKEGDLRLWEVRTGKQLATLRPPTHSGNWVQFCFTPDGQFLAIQDLSSDWPDTDFIRFWSIPTKKDTGRIRGYFGHMQIASDSRTIATLSRKNHRKVDRVIFWSSPAGGPPRRLREIRLSADYIAFSSDLFTMASADEADNAKSATRIAIWDTASGLKRCSFEYDEGDTAIQRLSFGANAGLLVASGGGGSQLDWHTQTTLLDVASTPTQIGPFSPHATFSSDGQWVAVPHEDAATLYRLAGMQERGTLRVTDDVGPSARFGTYNNRKEYPSLIFSPDARLLAVSGLFHIYGQTLPLIDWMPSWIVGLIYPSLGDGSVVRLWETDTGKQHTAFSGCRQAFFSPDGKFLATLHTNGIVRLWALPLHKQPANSLAWATVIWLPLVLIWQCGIILRRKAKTRQSEKDVGTKQVRAGHPGSRHRGQEKEAIG